MKSGHAPAHHYIEHFLISHVRLLLRVHELRRRGHPARLIKVGASRDVLTAVTRSLFVAPYSIEW